MFNTSTIILDRSFLYSSLYFFMYCFFVCLSSPEIFCLYCFLYSFLVFIYLFETYPGIDLFRILLSYFFLEIIFCIGHEPFVAITAWKLSIFEVFLVRTFPPVFKLNTVRYGVFRPNGGKCGPEKLRIRTLHAVNSSLLS